MTAEDVGNYFRSSSPEERRHVVGTVWLVIALLALIVLSIAIGQAHAQTTWTQCATEGNTCTLPTGQWSVRYGQPWVPAPNGSWTAVSTRTGAFPCSNASFISPALPSGDPSPGTGKRCEYAALIQPPPPAQSPILPPLTSGETYVVTWTPPTTNTDGTPIKPILKTVVQASATQDFAAYYEWVALDPAATRVEAKYGPTGTLYWRARVETADGVSDYTPNVMTRREYASLTKPVCWPRPIGLGTWPKASQNEAGWAIYWQCTVNGVASHAGVYGRWDHMDSDWTTQLAAAIPGGPGAFDTLWASRAGTAGDYSAVKGMWDALRDANPLPVTVHVVAPSSVSSRPAYAIVNGARTTKLAGRVGVGMPCDCEKFKSGTGSSMYCSVEGQANVATAAVDVLPASAAICRMP